MTLLRFSDDFWRMLLTVCRSALISWHRGEKRIRDANESCIENSIFSLSLSTIFGWTWVTFATTFSRAKVLRQYLRLYRLLWGQSTFCAGNARPALGRVPLLGAQQILMVRSYSIAKANLKLTNEPLGLHADISDTVQRNPFVKNIEPILVTELFQYHHRHHHHHHKHN